MKSRRGPTVALTLIVAACTGLSLAHWVPGGREFDRRVQQLWLGVHQRRNDPKLRDRQSVETGKADEVAIAEREATAALGRAREALDTARFGVAEWDWYVRPLLTNYDGHLIAANPDLVVAFRAVYGSAPNRQALPSLEDRLTAASLATDPRGRLTEAVSIRDEAHAFYDHYTEREAEALRVVAIARNRRLWSPVQLSAAMESLESESSRPARPAVPPTFYARGMMPWRPLVRRPYGVPSPHIPSPPRRHAPRMPRGRNP